MIPKGLQDPRHIRSDRVINPLKRRLQNLFRRVDQGCASIHGWIREGQGLE